MEYLKTLLHKNSFLTKFEQKEPKLAQTYFGGIFWNIMSLVFLAINLKWKLILLLILHHQSHICWYCTTITTNSSSWITFQDAGSQSSKKTQRMKLIFWLQINRKVSYKFIESLLVYLTRHAKSTQKKFTISLQ